MSDDSVSLPNDVPEDDDGDAHRSVAGDVVGRDKVVVDNSIQIKDIAGEAVAIGRGARAEVHHHHGIGEKDSRRLSRELRIFFVCLAGLILVVVSLAIFFNTRSSNASCEGADLCIAVAPFAQNQPQLIPEAGKKVAQGMYYRLNDIANQVNQNPDVRLHVTVLSPEQTELIAGNSRDERADNAERIADLLKADVVLYGTISDENGGWLVAPEFYVESKNFYEAEEIIGQYELGTPIQVILPDDASGRIPLNDALSSRSEALAWLTVGLGRYLSRKYPQALEYSQTAEEVTDWADAEGKEVVYLLAGNAAGKSDDVATAEEYYIKAQSTNPEYARAYAGLGNVQLQQALEAHTAGITDTTRLMLADAIRSYQQALAAPQKPAQSDIESKAHFGLGRAYLLQAIVDKGDLAPAVQEFNWVIANYEKHQTERLLERAAEAHSLLGLIYRQSENDEASISEYQQAIDLVKSVPQLQEQQAKYHAALGDEFVVANNLTEAAESYTRAIELTTSPKAKADYQRRLKDVQSLMKGQ